MKLVGLGPQCVLEIDLTRTQGEFTEAGQQRPEPDSAQITLLLCLLLCAPQASSLCLSFLGYKKDNSTYCTEQLLVGSVMFVRY